MILKRYCITYKSDKSDKAPIFVVEIFDNKEKGLNKFENYINDVRTDVKNKNSKPCELVLIERVIDGESFKDNIVKKQRCARLNLLSFVYIKDLYRKTRLKFGFLSFNKNKVIEESKNVERWLMEGIKNSVDKHGYVVKARYEMIRNNILDSFIKDYNVILIEEESLNKPNYRNSNNNKNGNNKTK